MTPNRRDLRVYRRAWLRRDSPGHRAAAAAGCRSTASWRWRCTRRASGYYANGGRQFGAMPASGSDFVTAPEMTPLFGQALARAGGAGAGSAPAPTRCGSSAPAPARWRCSCCDALGERVQRYHIVDLSAACASASARRWRRWRDRVRWLDACPSRCTAWWSATRCSMRCRCSCCAATRRTVARARRGAWPRWRLRLAGPADRRCARRCSVGLRGLAP